MERERKYSLALGGQAARVIEREAQKGSSTDEEDLEKRRLEFAQMGRMLEHSIKRLMVEPEAPPAKDAPPEIVEGYMDRQRKRAEEANQIHTLCSLKGITGLYDGLGLIADMVSLRQRVKDKKSGEKYIYRETIGQILFDMAAFMEDLLEMQAAQVELLEEIAKAHGATWRGKFTKRVKPEADVQAESAEPIQAGVPEKDLAAAKVVTEAQVDAYLGKK